MKERFIYKSFKADSLAKIEAANAIIDEYQDQGLTLTLRQLYYQFVSRDLIPNTDRSYKNLAAVISDGRLAGLIDWEGIEDRLREPVVPSEWDSIQAIVRSTIYSYRLPRWRGQETYCELWVEKDALAGVLEPIAEDAHVTLMVNRGYSSQSAMYRAAQRFANHSDKDRVIFYLGDHDPSGEDMVRDIRDRLDLFGVEDLRVEKIALTMDQIEEYNSPPNPVKKTDVRAEGYIQEHGESSWEVDALPPNVLANLIRAAFDSVIDRAAMDAVIDQENADKERLIAAVSKL